MYDHLPQGPKGNILWGNMLAMRKDPLAFWTWISREYGDFVFVPSGRDGGGVFFVNDADAIQQVLVTDNKMMSKGQGLERTKPLLGEGLLTSEGEFHRRQRRLVMPAFHRKRIAEYAGIMSRYTEAHGQGWSDGREVDMNEEMMRLTLQIVGKTLFDTDVSKQAKAVGEMLDTLLDGWWIGMLMPKFLFELFLKFPLPMLKHFHRAIEDMDAIIYRLIRERRASGEDHGDLLSMLLQSVDEDEDGGQMSDKQARDEAMTLFLAGHETTANALTWTLYLLSQHPEVMGRLQEEVDRVLGDGLPGMEDMAKLEYTEQVFTEAMRLYPPAWGLGRKTLGPYDLMGHQLPEGMTIFISMYVVHRDPRHYDDPEEFRPQRWTAEQKSSRHRFSYFPFGGGLRRCVGEAFAWMEGIMVLATLLREWEVELVEEQEVIPEPRITMRPKNGIRMRVRRRKAHRAAPQLSTGAAEGQGLRP